MTRADRPPEDRGNPMSSDSARQSLPESPGTFYTDAVRLRLLYIGGPVVVWAMVGFLYLALWLGAMYMPRPDGPFVAAVGIGGMALGLVSVAVLGLYVTLWRIRRLRSPLQARCEALYSVSMADMLQVGVSPGREVRYYVGETSYDIGFLSPTSDRMTYYGDRTMFELLPHQVEDVQVRNLPITASRMPTVVVTWRADPIADPQVLRLEIRDAATYRELRSLTDALARQIEEWRGSGAFGTPGASAASPDFTGVTGRESARPNLSWSSQFLVILIGLTLWFGLRKLGILALGPGAAHTLGFSFVMAALIGPVVLDFRFWLGHKEENL